MAAALARGQNSRKNISARYGPVGRSPGYSCMTWRSSRTRGRRHEGRAVRNPRVVNALIPLITVLVAFVVGGLVVLATRNNPLTVYRSLWVGAGFDWPFQYLPGNPFGVDGTLAEINLVATIVQATPLVLTGLAVAFAFRCGLFNIGGQGQFVAGSLAGFAVAAFVGGPLGLLVGTLAGAAGGALLGGFAGALKAFRGAHEVITTIMLNWIAIFVGKQLTGLGGALQDASSGQPATKQLNDATQFPIFWGDIQGVHLGLLIALAAAVVYSLVLRRTTLGFEVRAVGFNPEAARYGGVSVRRSIMLSLAISGAFAGLAGSGEVLGVQHRLSENEITVGQLGFTGIAVALLGRNTGIGCVLGALLFAALDAGARNLGGSDFSPELARTLATIIQGVIILLVGGEAIVRWIFKRRRRKATVTLPPTAASPSVEGGAAL